MPRRKAEIFYIDYIAATAALVIAWGLFLYIKHRQFEVDFGDARRGFLYSRIRMNLYKLARTPVHPKNWRPTMVILSSRPEMQFYMPYFATMLESDRGIISMVQFVECRVDSDAFGMRDQYRKQLAGILEQHEIYSVFPEVVVCKDFDKALYIFLQSHLVGPLKPNIVMMGFPDNEERIDQNIRHIRTIQTLHMSCVMMHNFDRYRRPCCPRACGHLVARHQQHLADADSRQSSGERSAVARDNPAHSAGGGNGKGSRGAAR